MLTFYRDRNVQDQLTKNKFESVGDLLLALQDAVGDLPATGDVNMVSFRVEFLPDEWTSQPPSWSPATTK